MSMAWSLALAPSPVSLFFIAFFSSENPGSVDVMAQRPGEIMRPRPLSLLAGLIAVVICCDNFESKFTPGHFSPFFFLKPILTRDP